LVVAVVIHNPKGAQMGGLVAAPLFSKVMENSLRILNVAPDDVRK
jgi:cell division protein FtsI (penicillin-binding protein 3)